MRRLPLILALLTCPSLLWGQIYIPAWKVQSQTSVSGVGSDTTSSAFNIRVVVEADMMPDDYGSPTTVQLGFRGHSNTPLEIGGLTICERSGSTYEYTMICIGT